MSAPYLNRGESIVLTTHRVSAGSVLYDAILTSERLILMDSRYTRFEPRMLPFSAINSVKGGKVPTGEPVIILMLDEPSDVSGSTQLDLIFTQQPGEQRNEEREFWVRKIIDLVISARELAVQKTLAPLREKTGLHPTVRRWLAPDPARPHTSVEKAVPLPRKMVAIPDETDLPVYIRKELSPEPEVSPSIGETDRVPEEEPVPVPVIPSETDPEVPISPTEIPAEDARAVPDEIPGAESPPVPEDRILELLYEESAVTPAADAKLPTETGEPSVSFASTLQSALQSLQSRDVDKEPPEKVRDGLQETGESAATEMPAPVSIPADARECSDDTEMTEDLGIPENPGLQPEPAPSDPDQHREPDPGQDPAAIEPTGEVPTSPIPDFHVPALPEEPKPPHPQPADDREPAVRDRIPEEQERPEMPLSPDAKDLHEGQGVTLSPDAGVQAKEIPGVPSPDTPVPLPHKEPQEPGIPARQPGLPESARPPASQNTVITTIAIVLIAILVLAGAIFLTSHSMQGNHEKIPAAIVTPAITVTQTPSPVQPGTSPSGIRVDVSYPGMFTGTVGNPGFLHQVSGNGNRTFTFLMTTGVIQATIQKQDNSGDALTVGIYHNGTLLAEKTVTAPMGEINLLIDTKTSSPPGIAPDTLPADNRTRLGNGTLVDY